MNIHDQRIIGIGLSWEEIRYYKKFVAGEVINSWEIPANTIRSEFPDIQKMFDENAKQQPLTICKSLAKKNLIILEIDGDTWTATGLGE